MGLDVEIQGLVETQNTINKMVVDLHGKPMLNAMRHGTLLIANDVKRLTPVDTGMGRASVTPEVRFEDKNVLGVVGSNKKYMLFLEVGTKPHWPPRSALEGWARRHGTTSYVVARAIAARGTKANRMFQQAAERNEKEIIQLINKAVEWITRQ